jgi:apolipoprotein N-acyltransferase
VRDSQVKRAGLSMPKIISLSFSSLAPVLTGVLLALAFPNHDLHWLAWMAFVPLLLALRRKGPWRAFLISWLCGVVFFFAITSWWISEFRFVSAFASGLGYLYLALYSALFGLFLSLIGGKVRLPLSVVAPPLWVAFEYLRSNAGFLAFPWTLVGHTQYLNLPIAQMASFAGVYGVSFIVVAVNAVIAEIIIWLSAPRAAAPLFHGYRRFLLDPPFQGLLALVILVLLWSWGYHDIDRKLPASFLSVALVQGNIPQKVKWDRQYREQIVSQYERLTDETARFRPQLIVWPEAATPGFVLNDLSLLRRMGSVMSRIKAYFLVGSAEYPKFSGNRGNFTLKRGNTALFFSPEGRVIGQYLKMRLVPFGEYVPYENLLPWPDFIVPRGKRNFETAGREATVFRLGTNSFGTVICWEVLFPEFTRELVKRGAGFVINLTNEAWFGRTAFPYQMLSSCVFRAVENRINLVRCANTGISCFIDPYGRITGRIRNGGRDTFISGILSQEIRLSSPGTFYTRHGDLFALACILVSLGFFASAMFRRSPRVHTGDAMERLRAERTG